MKFLRLILVPLVPIYWTVTWLRNLLYDLGVFSSKEYPFPLICVGNLNTGGTGKTPMIEYLVEILSSKYRLAILSRGYKRKSEGFILAHKHSVVDELGDEPFQMHRKFENVMIAVDSNRQKGINELMKLQNPPEIILLDDAFQHRSVNAGLNVVLTTFKNPYYNDILLPTGNLREPRVGAKRADIIVVTKCPRNITEEQKHKIEDKLDLTLDQDLYYGTIEYSEMISGTNSQISLEDLSKEKFTLVTGIANPKPLLKFLKTRHFDFEHLNFPDHHDFTKEDLLSLKNKKLILTTEKDFVRLEKALHSDRLFYIPIRTTLHDHIDFENRIMDFCKNYSMGAAEF